MPRPALSTTKPKVGQVIRASHRATTPTPDRVVWRWYRDGKPIRYADERTYRVSPDDVGHRLTARYFPERHLFKATSDSSARTAKVPVAKATVKTKVIPTKARGIEIRVVLKSPKVDGGHFNGKIRIYRQQRGSDLIKVKSIKSWTNRYWLENQPRGKQTYYVKYVDRKKRFAPATSKKVKVKVR